MTKIYFIKQPDDIRFIEGTHTRTSDERAQEFIDEGVAIPYKEEASKEQNMNQLPLDFSSKTLLEGKGFTNVESLPENLNALKEIKGIGEAKLENIEDALDE